MLARADTAPFSRHEWMLSLRYLRARRKEGFISVIAGFSFLGIMLGVATLIIVMAVMNGFRTELQSKILGVNGHMIVQGVGTPIMGFEALAEKARAVAGVTSAIPFIEGRAMATARRRATGAMVRGLRAKDLMAFKTVSDKLRSGSLDGFADNAGIAIGSRLSLRLGAGVGDKVTLISPNGPPTPFGVAPQVRTYPVVAVFQIGMSEYDSTFIFMPFKLAQEYFRTGEGATGIEIMVEDVDEVERQASAIEPMLGESAQLSTWKQRNVTFFNALQVERNVMFLILTLIVLVAALNIISGLIMLVKDKGRDIAVLRSMGATRGSVMRVFFITGASIGVFGTLAGLVLGVVFCWNIEPLRQFISRLSGTELFSPELYYLSQLPAEMQTGETVTIVVMALVLSFIATLYPSWRAARLDPVEALRYE